MRLVSYCTAGMDVARKVVILARECGLQLGLDDLTVASLVPPQLAALATPAEYMAALPQVWAGSVHVKDVHLTLHCRPLKSQVAPDRRYILVK
jgi:homoserine dehydrogenase